MANQTDTTLRKIFLFIPLLGLICLAVSIGLAIKDNRFTMATYVGMGVGILLFLTLFVKAEVANLKYYLHVFVYSALVFGICVVGYLFINQHKRQVDLTKENLYSLNPASVNYLKNLNKDVEIVFFTTTPEPFRQIEEQYTDASKKLHFEFINPVKDRLKATSRAKELGIIRPTQTDLVLKCGTKAPKRMSVNELLAGNYENVLTNAIVEVASEGTAKIYFTTGHGELPFEGAPPRRRGEARPDTVQVFRQTLKDRAMATEQLDLLAKGAVPDDATAVVIAGPNGDLTDKESAALRAYLDKGGRLLVLVGPSIEQQRAVNFDQLAGLLKNYGIELPNDIILDLLSAQFSDASKPLVAYMDKDHPITKDLANASSRSFLSLVRPVLTSRVGDNRIQATELIRSSDSSFLWPIADALAGNRATPPAQDQLKAQPMGVAVGMMDPPQIPGQQPIPKPKSYRVVVYGTPDLVSDQTFVNQPLFQMLMLNTMNWLAEREDALNIPPRKLSETPIIIDMAQQRVMFVFAVLLLPGLLFFGGVSYSLIRRRK